MTVADSEIDIETLETSGWLILDAAEYKREMASRDNAPSAQRMRKEARKRILQRVRQLQRTGDPLQLAEKILDIVKLFGKT